MYDSEDYKIEIWRAAAYGARALANALPFAVTIAALAFLIQSTLSQPFTLSCKSEPTKAIAQAVATEPMTEDLVDRDKKVEAPEAEPTPHYLYKEKY